MPLNGAAIRSLKHSILGDHYKSVQRAVSRITSTQRYVPPEIHITALELQRTPESVVSTVKLLHSSPPTPDPSRPFDLVLHVCIGSAGAIRIEGNARKSGYSNDHAQKQKTPFVNALHPAPIFNRDARVSIPLSSKPVEFLANEVEARYKDCPDQIWNSTIDVVGLVEAIQDAGLRDVVLSNNAGLQLSELVYYCSLSEGHLGGPAPDSNGKRNGTKVLLVHVPPIGRPQTVAEMTFAIEEIIRVLCWGNVYGI